MFKYMKQVITPDVQEHMKAQLAKQPIKLSDTPVCDFCGDQSPKVVFANHGMSNGKPYPAWRWRACVGCEHAIDNRNWLKLRGRITARLRLMMPGTGEYILGQAVDNAMAKMRLIEVEA